MGSQTIEADGVVLGVREVEHWRRRDTLFAIRPTDSYAYFCPKCGDIWGRLRHEGASYWQCVYRYCRAHGDGRLSMQYPAGQPTGIERNWPRAALLREFMIELEELERISNG